MLFLAAWLYVGRSKFLTFRFLLAKDYKEIVARVIYLKFTIKVVPYYVSIEGLPPDVEECRGFYDL